MPLGAGAGSHRQLFFREMGELNKVGLIISSGKHVIRAAISSIIPMFSPIF